MTTRAPVAAPRLESASRRASALRWMDRWIDPVLLLAAALTIPLIIVETGSPSDADKRILDIVNWGVWAVFTLNYVVRIAIAHDRRAEARSLKWDLVIVIGQPVFTLTTVFFTSGVALIRLLVVAIRTFSRGAVIRRAWRKVRLEPLRIVAGVVPFVWLTSAALVLRVEDPDSSVDSIGDALWWGAATLTTVGYGDVLPSSAVGRTLATATMLVGIGMFSVITAKLADQLLSQRAATGRTEIIEEGHTVVLGWTPKVFTIVRELVLANDGRGRATVVVLGEEERQVMARQVEAQVPALRRSNTTLLCRTGSPAMLADLRLVRPDRARSVIVVDDGSGDAAVVKAVLALLSSTADDEPTRPRIVAEIDDHATAAALESAFPRRLTIVEPASFIARTTAHACRSPAVALAYEHLLGFAGAEMYIHSQPETAGLRFGDLLLGFADACVIGVVGGDGNARLNPPSDTTIEPGDWLVVVAEDAGRITWTGVQPERAARTASRDRAGQQPVHVAVFGWSSLGARVVTELDNYVVPGSTITVVLDGRSEPDAGELPSQLTRGNLSIRRAGGTDHVALVREVSESCDHAVVLCERDGSSVAEADTRALLTMLQVRQASLGAGRDVNLVTELLDERNVDLVPRSGASNFIISERLVSLLLTQLSENPGLAPIFHALLDAEGCELYGAPAGIYVPEDEEVTFADVVAAAGRAGEIAVGYRVALDGNDPARNFGLVLNPRKDAVLRLAEADQVIVLAEEQP